MIFTPDWSAVVTVVAALVIGKTVAARPSKIIAGHEADKTNELLQALAEAINKKVCVCKIYITYTLYFALLASFERDGEEF